MKEIITSILQAEKNADEILKSASNSAKAISKESILKSDAIREKAIIDFKAFKKQKITDAEKQAELEYAKIIEKGNVESDSLIASVSSKVDKIVKETVKEILD